jgi:solute carrier family 25 (mitochondrial oxoglutarate transporter), member 11
MVGGILSNPFEIVFTRMQADGMYPESQRRNYRSFVDGLVKVTEEGALFRGAMANGLKLGGMVCLASGIMDFMKENSYYFFGPMPMTRGIAVTAGAATAMALSMPFDAIKTRLHTMRPLPNGELPYSGTFDCLNKMIKYEARWDKQSNYGVFFTGGQPYFARLLVIAMLSMGFLDWYHGKSKSAEFWQPARFQYTTGIDYDIHDPYTEGYYKQMATNWMAKGGHGGLHPDGKSQIKLM